MKTSPPDTSRCNSLSALAGKICWSITRPAFQHSSARQPFRCTVSPLRREYPGFLLAVFSSAAPPIAFPILPRALVLLVSNLTPKTPHARNADALIIRTRCVARVALSRFRPPPSRAVKSAQNILSRNILQDGSQCSLYRASAQHAGKKEKQPGPKIAPFN